MAYSREIDAPEWRAILKEQFAGASIESTSDEAFHSLLGFHEDVVTKLWVKYGRQIMDGQQPITPLRFLWFLSYLRSGLKWIYLSIIWRASISTMRRVISSAIKHLSQVVDEVGIKLDF